MVRKDKQGFFKNNKKIKSNLDLLDKNLLDLYQTTYYNQKDNINSSEEIRDDIDKSIDDIMSNTYSNTSMGNMTKIYTKLQLNKMQGDKDLSNALKMFEDPLLMNNILATQNQNRWIKDLDNEIDMVLKYMPKLREALNAKKDSVLSADHFSKDFVNFHSTLSQNKQGIFERRIEEIKRVYNLPKNFERWYDDAQTYGECFIYTVPYSAAFAKLLKNRNTKAFKGSTLEMTILNEGTFDSSFMGDSTGITASDLTEFTKNITNKKNSNITVTLNTSGILLSAANGLEKASKIIKENKFASLNEIYTECYQEIKEAAIQEKASENGIASPLIPSDLELPKNVEGDNSAQEGIFTGAKNIHSDDDPKITVPGCIVKQLDRANVLPIYIEDICLGYYYFECKNNSSTFDDPNLGYPSGVDTFGSSNRLQQSTEKMMQDNQNKVINYIAKQLSDVIDKDFINANQDLRKELYMILKHNDIFNCIDGSMSGNIEITFLPAEDVHHIAFKTDPITHRGISDLQMALFPAKLYSCLYITYVLGTLTRGQDKRVYYVKQNVETNISKTMLNVLNQIKKGNFGARQMENLSSILNITGRFNDYIIPMSQSGEVPIQFEVMEGQKFEVQSDLMDQLEQMAINATDVPIELINVRQTIDYAIQATMSNSKFMRNVYNRQDDIQKHFGDITSKIYNYEYLETETIEMALPAPAFLNMTNGAQLINGTIDYVNNLAELQLTGQTDDVKAEFKRLGVNHYLSTHIDMSTINRLVAQAKINVEKQKSKSDQAEE